MNEYCHMLSYVVEVLINGVPFSYFAICILEMKLPVVALGNILCLSLQSDMFDYKLAFIFNLC